MRILRTDSEPRREISEFGSVGVALREILRSAGETTIHTMELRAGGRVGYHPAAAPQLFLVVAGEGWVRGASGERIPVTTGDAALWERGEWHASGTEAGLTALVVEGDQLEV